MEVITQGIAQASGGDAGILGIIAGAIADGLIGKDAFKSRKHRERSGMGCSSLI